MKKILMKLAFNPLTKIDTHKLWLVWIFSGNQHHKFVLSTSLKVTLPPVIGKSSSNTSLSLVMYHIMNIHCRNTRNLNSQSHVKCKLTSSSYGFRFDRIVLNYFDKVSHNIISLAMRF